MNCCDVPLWKDGFDGEMVIEVRVAEVIVTVVVAETLPDVAVMSELPAERAATSPVAPMVATEVVPEVQTTEEEISCVEPSLNVALAWSCSELPAASDGLDGEIEMDCTVAAVTVNVVEAVTPESEAPIVVVPAVRADASPVEEMEATDAVDDVHATVAVIVFTEPSLYVPCAVNWRLVPGAAEEFAGLIAIDCSVPPATEITKEEETPS